MNQSLVQQAIQTPEDQAILISMMEKADISEDSFLYGWGLFARPNQLPPKKDWLYWLLLAGRGFGKTRAGAEWVRNQVEEHGKKRIALVGATAADVRDIMVEGDSGILNVSPSWNYPLYIPSKTKLVWPNGAEAHTYSAEKPDRLRGPQHDCFVAGTKIRTLLGEIPIELLKIGDRVMTRYGEKEIVDCRNKKELVGKVVFSNGIELVGTKDHPIWVSNGWRSLSKLKKGDCAEIWNGKKHRTGILQPIKMERKCISIDGFGKDITKRKYPKDIMSIIRMGIRKITEYRILSLCRQKSIAGIIMRMLKRYIWSALIAVSRLLELRMILSPQYAGNARCLGRRLIERQLEHVYIAEKSFCREEEDFAVSVASTWEAAGRETVYNLSVKDQPEYYANNILVHNCAWADELASWQRMQDTWDMLMFGLRIGDKPQCVVTATPRPLNLIKELVKDKNTVVTSGDTFENQANLAPAFFSRIIQKYRGTRLGRQEIYAEILDDNPEALFNRNIIDKYRVDNVPELKLINVGVDPAVTSNENSNDTGIIVAGKDKKNHYYVLYDYTCHTTPERWARKCVNAYNDHQANRIVPEVNNGGDMVKALMKTIDPSVRVKSVRATRGKALRAEPISALYEQGRVHHVGIFPKLEDQQCQWDPGLNEDSPDRLDALVWALTDLSKTAGGKTSGY